MGDEGDLQSCMGRVTILAIYFASPPLAERIASQPIKSPVPLPRPPPANQWPDDADAYWAQNRPLVLAILCLYRYTLAALTALARLGPVLCL